jgi:sporulation protein YlmC with PRC-barrel domain
MDIPVNAQVKCADGPCGRCTHVVLNPTTEDVTYLVVKEEHFPHTERLVPVRWVMETTPELIRLRCAGDKVAELQPFIATEYIKVDIPGYEGGPCMMEPYVVPEAKWVAMEHECLLPGELAVRRGTQVEATDGHVGRVDEFLVNPANGYNITHLILREGHLWGQRDVTIPVSEIDRMGEDTVHLKMDKRSIEALPAIPVRRRWA